MLHNSKYCGTLLLDSTINCEKIMITEPRITSTFRIHINEIRTPQEVCRQLFWNGLLGKDVRIRRRDGERVKLNPKHFSVFKKAETFEVAIFEWYQGEICDLGLEMSWPGIRDQTTVCMRSYERIAKKVVDAGLVLPPDELAVIILEQHKKYDDVDESYDILAYPEFNEGREGLSPVNVFNIRSDSTRTKYEAYLEERKGYRGEYYNCLRVDHKRSLLCLVP